MDRLSLVHLLYYLRSGLSAKCWDFHLLSRPQEPFPLLVCYHLKSSLEIFDFVASKDSCNSQIDPDAVIKHSDLYYSKKPKRKILVGLFC